MLRSIATIFGKPPFASFQHHMDKVSACVDLGREILEAFYEGQHEKFEGLLKQISKLEHEADLAKISIRSQLPKNIFLPVDRSSMLELLSLQDSIANTIENLAVVISLRPLRPVPSYIEKLRPFAAKNFEAFQGAKEIVLELSTLAQSSFGGAEAYKVKKLIDQVAYLEHEADLLQRDLLKVLFSYEEEISTRDFYIWIQLIKQVGSLADISDKLAHKILITLQLT